jgi:cell division protein FtsB
MKKRRQRVRRQRPFRLILASALLLGIFSWLIESYVQLDSTQKKLAVATAELAEYKSENVRLESKLEAQVSVKNVESYAEDVLNMKKLDSSQIKYIKIQEKDTVVLPEEEENIYVRIKDQFYEVIEYLRG